MVFLLRLASEHATTEKVWPYNVAFFNELFKILQLVTHTAGHTPYSLKRGGATAHFLTFRSLDRLVHDGRWLSIQAARIYVDDAVASLVRQRVPDSVRSPRYARRLKSFCLKLGGGAAYSYLLEV